MASTDTAEPRDRFVDGVRESAHVWVDLLREGNDRLHQMNRLLLDEADRTQEESAELIGRFLSAPTQIGDFTSALVGTLQERGRRRMSLTRRLMGDLGEAAGDTRRLLSRSAAASRRTIAATAEAGREAADELAAEIRGGNGRRTRNGTARTKTGARKRRTTRKRTPGQTQ